MSRKLLFLFTLLLLLLSSCNNGEMINPTPITVLPTPTVHQLFNGLNLTDETQIDNVPLDNEAHPTLASYFLDDVDPAQPKITATPAAKPDKPKSLEAPFPSVEVVIFDEELHQNWIKVNDTGISNLVRSSVAHNGEKVLKVNFSEGFSKQIFAVQDGTTESYPRDLAQGVSFWLYSEEEHIANSDLSVTVLGSNVIPYWNPDDNSVKNSYKPIFSETRLYFLNFNRSIPPETWVEVVVWLNDLIYDPDYEYVTGMYILSDETFANTILIDEVKLIMKEPGPIVLDEGLLTEVSPSPTIESIKATEKTPAPEIVLPNQTPQPISGEILVNANCRAGPGIDYPITNSPRQGQLVNIQGRNSTSDWYLIYLPNESSGCWISADLIQNDQNDAELPVLSDDPES